MNTPEDESHPQKPENASSVPDPSNDQTIDLSFSTRLPIKASDNLSTVFPDDPSQTQEMHPDSTILPIDSDAIDSRETLSPDSTILPISSKIIDSRETLPPDATIDVPSPLHQPNVSMTVNPRDLSERDQAEWSRAVSRASPTSGSTPEADSSLPAFEKPVSHEPIRRSQITESKLLVPTRQLRRETENDPTLPTDYQLVDVLGQGGMGTVFLARQVSLDRLVALKVVRPIEGDHARRLAGEGKLEQAAKTRRDQFLSEAIVTGDLDHPNIVPIHDLARSENDTLFYAMKKVEGIPWSRVIRQKSTDDNLDILLKVCDAIAFSHSRGIVHRDIKPENVMLGDYGVVMLMDWGLAVPKPNYSKRDSIYQSTSLGGSPAYMAPEMATGPVESIGPASDIYLLGATLYEIVVGRPPHGGRNVSECLKAVSNNVIIEAPEKKRDSELLQIALRAMATNPQDRFATASDLQQAIRQYRAHEESFLLTYRAEEDHVKGLRSKEYIDFSRSVFGFEEALKLWPENKRAAASLKQVKLAFAGLACKNEDYDLGLSLLDESESEFQPLIEKLRLGQQDRDSRRARLGWMKRIAASLLGIVIVGGSYAIYKIAHEKNLAIDSRNEARKSETLAIQLKAKAEENRATAERKTKEAEANRLIAVENEKTAEENAQEAIANAQEAARQRELAVYEAYVAQIGLAKARIDQNEFDDARAILRELKSNHSADTSLGWEWQWLWSQANQSLTDTPLDEAASNLSVGLSGQWAWITDVNGRVHKAQRNGDQQWSLEPISLHPEFEVNATAVSPNEQWLALACKDGSVHLLDAARGELKHSLRGHNQSVNAVQFLDNVRVVSASDDRSVRVWNLEDEQEIASGWHLGSVQSIAVHNRSDKPQILCGVANDQTGQAILWELDEKDKTKPELHRVVDFLDHETPVTAVALSSDGLWAASGDRSGKVLLWSPREASLVNQTDQVSLAVRRINRGEAPRRPVHFTATKPLIDGFEQGGLRLVSTKSAFTDQAHQDAISSIHFSPNSMELLTSSTDYTIKVWDVRTQSLASILRGHGGAVRSAEYLPGLQNQIISVANDATIRTWKPNESLHATVLTQSSEPATFQSLNHPDEIYSASFDPTGRRVLTAGRDHTARISLIDPQTRKFTASSTLDPSTTATLAEASTYGAWTVAYDQTQDRLFVGSADSIVRSWNAANGTETSSAPGIGLSFGLAVSPAGDYLVTGSSNAEDRALVWEVSKQGVIAPEPKYRLREHTVAVTTIAISPDSRLIFTGDSQGVGILWDAKSGKTTGTRLTHHQGMRINAAVFTPASDAVWLGAEDQRATLSRASDGKLLKNLPHEGAVTKLSLDSTGHCLATISEDNRDGTIISKLQLWNDANEKQIVLSSIVQPKQTGANSEDAPAQQDKKVDPLQKGRFLALSFLPQSPELIVSQSDGSSGVLTIWNSQKSESTSARVRAVRFPKAISPVTEVLGTAPRQFVSLHGDAAFRWDLDSLKHVRTYRPHGSLTEADFSFDGKYVVTGSGSLKVWNVEETRSIGKIEIPHSQGVRSVQFHPKKYQIASAGSDGVVRLWNWYGATSSVSLARELKTEPRAALHRVRYSPSGDYLVAVGDGGLAFIWDLRNEGAPKVFSDPASKAPYLCAAFSNDEAWIAVGSTDRIARIWATGAEGPALNRPTVRLQGHADDIEDIVFMSQDNKNLRLLTASRDKSARLWDPRLNLVDASKAPELPIKGREILSLRKHALGLTSIAVSPDELAVLTASRDGTTMLWPVTGER